MFGCPLSFDGDGLWVGNFPLDSFGKFLLSSAVLPLIGDIMRNIPEFPWFSGKSISVGYKFHHYSIINYHISEYAIKRLKSMA
jgi:hypothetical protein